MMMLPILRVKKFRLTKSLRYLVAGPGRKLIVCPIPKPMYFPTAL